MKLQRSLLFIDLETTGVDPQESRIVELACVKLFPDGTREKKRYLINPLVPIPKSASDIHGITNEMVKDAPAFKQISVSFHQYITDCDLAGFRCNHFDFPLLYSEFLRSGIEWDYNKHALVDVGNIYTIQEPRTLSAAVKFYCGKELEGAHGALADIEATVDVFEAQVEKYTDLPKDINELAIFSNYGRKILDMAGLFTYAEDGVTIIFAKGKHKDKVATLDNDYLSWVVYKSNFPPDTRKLAKQLMDKIPYR